MQHHRGTLIALAIAFLGIVALLPAALSLYDEHTEERLLETLARELPPGASMAQMNAFMQRHTSRYDYDPKDEMIGGFLPQSTLDKIAMDRQVGISLKVNKGSKTFKRADVQVYYTFL